MRLFGFLAFIALVHATALTAILAGGEKSCYYADVDGVGEKIGARLSLLTLTLRFLLCSAIRRHL